MKLEPALYEKASRILSRYFDIKADGKDEKNWERLLPLLSLLDREFTVDNPEIKPYLINAESITPKRLDSYCTTLQEKGLIDENEWNQLYGCIFRLPTVVDEFTVITDPINTEIGKFNQLIEGYYDHPEEQTTKQRLTSLNDCYNNIIKQIQEKGSHCNPHALAPLLSTLCSWCHVDSPLSLIEDHFRSNAIQHKIKEKRCDQEGENDQRNEVTTDTKRESHRTLPTELGLGKDDVEEGGLLNAQANVLTRNVYIENKQSDSVRDAIDNTTPETKQYTFEKKSTHDINAAGLMSDHSVKLILNAFGMKPGGHVDAIATPVPKLMRTSEFMRMFFRELAQRMNLEPFYQEEKLTELQSIIINVLTAYGLSIVWSKRDEVEAYINPFAQKPMVLQSPRIMEQKLKELISKNKNIKIDETDQKSMLELLDGFIRRMQINPNVALGIGANHDGTIDRCNDAGIYAFQFGNELRPWAEAFQRLSVCRQGPAQAYMNAMSVAKYEALTAFAQSFEYMTSLQPSEHENTLYNGVLDNLFADLFPHPDRVENPEFDRFSKVYTLSYKEGTDRVHEHTVKSQVGIYKKNGSQVPKHRLPGTPRIVDALHDTGEVCGATRNSFQGNPFVNLQLQYAQSLCPGERGNLVYSPTGKDRFMPDPYGQTVRIKNGSFMPLIGLIPKNFDKKIKHNTEACSSYVARMVQSAGLVTNSTVFQQKLEEIKFHFLPSPHDLNGITTPEILKTVVQTKWQECVNSVEKKAFTPSVRIFRELFNCVLLKMQSSGTKDPHCNTFMYDLIRKNIRNNQSNRLDREYFDAIIRELELYRPRSREDQNYNTCIDYLKKVTNAFFPKATDHNAKLFETYAKQAAHELKKNADIKNYFCDLKHNFPQANTSRTLTPGQWGARMDSLINGEAKPFTSKQVMDLHEQKFPSGYYGVNGEQDVSIEERDRKIDWVIKKAGSISACFQTFPCKCCGSCAAGYRVCQSANVAYHNDGISISCLSSEVWKSFKSVINTVTDVACCLPNTLKSCFMPTGQGGEPVLITNPFSIPATPMSSS